jgi:hypothetical protein
MVKTGDRKVDDFRGLKSSAIAGRHKKTKIERRFRFLRSIGASLTLPKRGMDGFLRN